MGFGVRGSGFLSFLGLSTTEKIILSPEFRIPLAAQIGVSPNKYIVDHTKAQRATKLTQYRQLMKQLIKKYAELFKRGDKPGEESQAVIDEVGGNYSTVGWVERQRVFLTRLYVRLQNGKFWIEVDWLEDGIVTA